ncbi:Armadillo/beta-catenin repeat family protein [Forsythia ovata]|uniref:Armadillo/beta-catenin repeat family protein n=1 Tax=Forsythia ovata TaxID=205694 RepID=A0ABD1VGX8_9LAMI
MYIEELKEGDLENGKGLQLCGKEENSENEEGQGAIVIWDAKRVLVGAGARVLFYPTLLYNVVRNKIQSEFRWWDRVDESCIEEPIPIVTQACHDAVSNWVQQTRQLSQFTVVTRIIIYKQGKKQMNE